MTERPRRKRIAAPVRRLGANYSIDSQDLDEVKAVFGIDNAKQMAREDTVRYFVPPPEFTRLFVAKHQVLVGSRGSGKTTWVRMLAHDHVALAAKDGTERSAYARSALARNLIGIYVPASAAFAGDLKNKPWQTEEDAEQYFVWRLNLHTCAALTHILPSCVDQFVPLGSSKISAEKQISLALANAWSQSTETCNTFAELRSLLSGMELRHQTEMRRRRTSSQQFDPYIDHFDADLFLPLRHAINVIKTVVPVNPGAVWMVCLDEVEYLSEAHHQILNTQMRASSGDIVLKIATMPFAHHTLATNVGDPIREGNDFEYIYVDRDPIDSRGAQAEGEFLTFAREMFRKRVAKHAQLKHLTLKALLGGSPLLDEKKMETSDDYEAFMSLLRRHANPPTLARGERLRGSPKFKSEIVRKMHGALLLRDALTSLHGNAKLRVYSGEAMVVRCCDGNARRLMRVINLLVQRIQVRENGTLQLPLDPAVQNEVLENIARDTLSRVHSEPPNGAITARYLHAVGKFMQWQFTSSVRMLGTDQVTSVLLAESDGQEAQKFIKQAVQLSLMIPGRDVPLVPAQQTVVGAFHLAFHFAPLFHLLPRRNDAVRLSRVLAHIASQVGLRNPAQPSLLDPE